MSDVLKLHYTSVSNGRQNKHLFHLTEKEYNKTLFCCIDGMRLVTQGQKAWLKHLNNCKLCKKCLEHNNAVYDMEDLCQNKNQKATVSQKHKTSKDKATVNKKKFTK